MKSFWRSTTDRARGAWGVRGMHPRHAALALGLALTGAMSLGSPPPRGRGARPNNLGGSSESALKGGPEIALATPCPTDTFLDGDVCVRWAEPDGEGLAEAESDVNAHRDRWGRWVVYDEIPRRPDRPADYDAYRYPVACGGSAHGSTERPCVVSGYDLDRADDVQRRARNLRQVGHGAVDLVAPRNTPVTSVALQHQRGDAEVVYVGPLFGMTVATRQTIAEGGRFRDYLLLFGHLDAAAPGLHRGSVLHEGDLLGMVGDTGSPNVVHLHLEVRRLRDGVDPSKLGPNALLDAANTVVCDPRNVLPLR